MIISDMNEKRLIEKGTADKFLFFYNNLLGYNFVVEEVNDSPDVICRDANTGEKLALEITLLEDVEGDAGYRLGRLENPKSKSGLPVRSFDIDTIPQLINRIIKKSRKDYGKNVALVIRQVSGVPWDFEVELDKIRLRIDLINNPYDRGIWLLTIKGGIIRIT
jgi:hypothetical protein